jgi:hypothetical protein
VLLLQGFRNTTTLVVSYKKNSSYFLWIQLDEPEQNSEAEGITSSANNFEFPYGWGADLERNNTKLLLRRQ